MRIRCPKHRLPRIARALACCVAGTALAALGTAEAQSYPTKPIRWVVTSTAGGAYDLITRGLMMPMSANLGQAIVVDNKPGASGIVGLEYTARAAPDGYTVLTAGISQFVLNPFFHDKVPYDTRKDFTTLGLIGDLVTALYVHRSIDVTTLKGLIDYSKANPGKLFYGSAGIGHSFHLATEILKLRTGADLTHVPYKGTAPAQQDFFTGRIQVLFYPPSAAMLNQIKAGVIRPLAAVSERRLPNLPDVPTFDEAGVPNLGVSGWGGLAGPAGMPREIVTRLNQALNKSAATPEAGKAFEAISMLPVSGTPEGMAERVRRDFEFWGPMIKKLGIKPEV